jgi:HK97 gp10 family phage protein
MATLVSKVTVDTSVLDKMLAEARPKAAQIVETYGKLMTADAGKMAPRDPSRPPLDPSQPTSGKLKASIQENSGMTGELTYTLQDGVEYGIFHELGTKRMRARPFIVPAVERWKAKFLAAFKQLVEP